MLKQQVKHESVHSVYTQHGSYLMAQQPYSPMHEPREPVSRERMQEILSKNSSQAEQSPKEKSGASVWPIEPRNNGVPPHPPRPTGQLEWADRAEGSMGRYSKCLWYSVCQINHGDEKTFSAWTRNTLTGGMRILEVGLPTFRAAIAICQKDADEHYARGSR